MLELIKNQSQRSVIALRQTTEGTYASFIIFDALNNARLIGEKFLNTEEVQSLLAQEENLALRNIFILREILSKPALLIASVIQTVYKVIRSIFSSGVSKFKPQLEFLSVQKTRGPNN